MTINNARTALSALLLVAACCGCSAKQPGVNNPIYQEAQFLHTIEFKTDCMRCHEKDRPLPSEKVAHGYGSDCADCHETSDKKAGWRPPKPFTHNPAPATCLGCHASKRPKAPHPVSGDCVSCHKYPSWQPI